MLLQRPKRLPHPYYKPQENRKKERKSQHVSWSSSCFLTACYGKEKQKSHSVHDCVESQE